MTNDSLPVLEPPLFYKTSSLLIKSNNFFYHPISLNGILYMYCPANENLFVNHPLFTSQLSAIIFGLVQNNIRGCFTPDLNRIFYLCYLNIYWKAWGKRALKIYSVLQSHLPLLRLLVYFCLYTKTIIQLICNKRAVRLYNYQLH